MSNLAKQIKAIQTDNRYPANISLDLFSMEEKYTPVTIDYRYDTQYDFKATWGCSSIISREAREDGGAMEEITRTVRRRVVEEVFGEFRKPLLELQQLAIRKYDQQAMELVRGILNNMFEV